MKYRFIDVGRNKATWEAETENPTYSWLWKQVHDHGVMSRNLDFYFVDDEFKKGVVEAGFRAIGRYEVMED